MASVLLVCTGNHCLSPAAEALLRRRLGRRSAAFEIWSAGTAAREGAVLHPLTGDALARHGAPLRSHRPRQLLVDDVLGADLVLCAERRHRVHVARLEPHAADKTFTLAEFGRLAPHLKADTLDVLLAQARALRSTHPALRPADDDVPDPVDGDHWVHEQTVSRLARLTAAIAAVLGRTSGGPSSTAPAGPRHVHAPAS
jgi:protein-tyrosine phosphatase